jgi:hypothetical protein
MSHVLVTGTIPEAYSFERRLKRFIGSTRLFILDASTFAVFFVLYYIARGIATEPVDTATENALDIISLEKKLGIFWEPAWQREALQHPWFMDICNFTYSKLHLYLFPVIGYLIFLRDRRRYRLVRNTLIISMAMAAPFYWFTPTAPPRLLEAAGHDFGFVDTVYRSSRDGFFNNDYAAIPSFHYGWNAFFLFMGWQVWKNWFVRLGGAAFSALMFVSIVVTANHFFFDMFLGVLVTFASYFLATRFEKWMRENPYWRERLTIRVRGYRLPF